MQFRTNGHISHEKVIARRFASATRGILAGDYTALVTMETEKDLELKKQAEE